MLIEAVIEDTPGIGITFIFFAIHSWINKRPGSERDGVPASEIRDIILYFWISETISEEIFLSLNLWYDTNFDLMS